jgi:hypothetical protein
LADRSPLLKNLEELRRKREGEKKGKRERGEKKEG